VFQAEQGQTVELDIALNLSIRSPDKVDYLEVVQDGKVVQEVRLDKFAEAKGKLPPVKFTTSGWMLVRAVTNNPKTYRFASTGPLRRDRLSAASEQGGRAVFKTGSMNVPGESNRRPDQNRKCEYLRLRLLEAEVQEANKTEMAGGITS
jgi:hypothetical protein